MKQYAALLGTEKVTLAFTDDAVDALAELAADINDRVENIGARRLHTVLERLLEEISFTATDKAGETVTVDTWVTQPIQTDGSSPTSAMVALLRIAGGMFWGGLGNGAQPCRARGAIAPSSTIVSARRPAT